MDKKKIDKIIGYLDYNSKILFYKGCVYWAVHCTKDVKVGANEISDDSTVVWAFLVDCYDALKLCCLEDRIEFGQEVVSHVGDLEYAKLLFAEIKSVIRGNIYRTDAFVSSIENVVYECHGRNQLRPDIDNMFIAFCGDIGGSKGRVNAEERIKSRNSIFYSYGCRAKEHLKNTNLARIFGVGKWKGKSLSERMGFYPIDQQQ